MSGKEISMLRFKSSRGKRHWCPRSYVNVVLWAMTFQLVVVPSSLQNAPGYLGCFEDDWDRVLEIGPKKDSEQSVEWCFRYCLDTQADDYEYAGVEYGEECFCGNNRYYARLGQKPDADCNYPCEGNEKQMCGGGFRISIYRISQGVCSNEIGPPIHGSHTIAIPSSVSYNLDSFKFFGTRVEFACEAGYLLHGASEIECIDIGNNSVAWSDSVPTCTAPTSTATSLSTTSSQHGSTVALSTKTQQDGTVVYYTHEGTSGAQASSSGINDRSTGKLETGGIIGIAAAALVALIVVVAILILLWRKRQNERKTSTIDTVGLSYSNNVYGLSDTAANSHTELDKAAQNVYCNVRQENTDDVYAIPDDVNVQTDDLVNDRHSVKLAAPSSDCQETEWVDNSLYESESFPGEFKAGCNHSDGGGTKGPQLPTEEQSGWIENIIYE